MKKPEARVKRRDSRSSTYEVVITTPTGTLLKSEIFMLSGRPVVFMRPQNCMCLRCVYGKRLGFKNIDAPVDEGANKAWLPKDLEDEYFTLRVTDALEGR